MYAQDAPQDSVLSKLLPDVVSLKRISACATPPNNTRLITNVSNELDNCFDECLPIDTPL